MTAFLGASRVEVSSRFRLLEGDGGEVCNPMMETTLGAMVEAVIFSHELDVLWASITRRRVVCKVYFDSERWWGEGKAEC